MHPTTPIDLDSVTRGDPYAWERMVEYALHQVERDVSSARARSADVVTAAREALEEVYLAYDAQKEAKGAIERAEQEVFAQLLLLADPEFFGDPHAVAARIDELTDQIKSLKTAASALGDYHLSRWGHYAHLAKYLGHFIAILPGVRREARGSKVLASLVRAGTLLTALGATVLLEIEFAQTLEDNLGRVLPVYAKAIAVIVFYLGGLLIIEKPLEWIIDAINWRRFDHIRALRAKHLRQIQDIDSQLRASGPYVAEAGT